MTMTPTDRPEVSKRVLVVDDSVATVRMMKVVLKRSGFDVRTALDGDEALDVARTFLPEIALLDLTLPGMTGEQIAQELRKEVSLARTLIVAISGYPNRGIPPGFDHLMVKPVDHDALVKLMNNHLSVETAGQAVAGN